MEQTALVLIAITLLMLVLILGLLTLLIYKMFRQKNPPVTEEAPKDNYHPEIRERMKAVGSLKTKRADLFCPNHSEEPGEVMCAVCDKLYCRACARPYKTMHLCKEHLSLVMRHDWEEILTLKTSTLDPEQGVRLYDFKKKIFAEQDIPTYVETHYKINVDQDYIETYLVLFAQEEKVEALKLLLPPDLDETMNPKNGTQD